MTPPERLRLELQRLRLAACRSSPPGRSRSALPCVTRKWRRRSSGGRCGASSQRGRGDGAAAWSARRVQGRVTEARGTAALRDALAWVLAGIWLSYDGRRLRAEFRMADVATAPTEAERRRIAYLFAHAEPVGLDAERVSLPGWQKSPHTLAVAAR